MSSFFEDHKDIKLCVHESLADFNTNRELKGWVSADEVIDTKPLFDEIRKLADENRSLKETLREMEKRAIAVANPEIDKKSAAFNELRTILKAVNVKVPESVTGDKEYEIDLLSLFYNTKEALINGVTNAINSSKGEIFLYHKVCPKLQVHGLSANEKVPGVRYRRSYVTDLGNSFLAQMDKSVVLKKKVVVVEKASETEEIASRNEAISIISDDTIKVV